MTEPNVTQLVTKRADELIVGDRIDRKHLPVFDEDAVVVFVRPYRELRAERWVFAAFEYARGYLDSTAFRPDAAIRVTPAADPIGEGFGREPDEHGPAEDMTLTPRRRREPHFEDGRDTVSEAR